MRILQLLESRKLDYLTFNLLKLNLINAWELKVKFLGIIFSCSPRK